MENFCSHKNLCTNVHDRFIYNSQTENKLDILPLVNIETKCSISIPWNTTQQFKKISNKLLKHTITWVSPEDIMLNEKIQNQKV